MRMCRRLGLSIGKRYTFYDYVSLDTRVAQACVVTPVKTRNVMIQTKFRYGDNGTNQMSIVNKLGTGGTADGFGVQPGGHPWRIRYAAGGDATFNHSISAATWYTAVFAVYSGNNSQALGLNGTTYTEIETLATEDSLKAWTLFGPDVSGNNMNGASKIREVKIYDYSTDALLADLKPSTKGRSQIIGFYDEVSRTFCPATVAGVEQAVGGSYFSVGNV